MEDKDPVPVGAVAEPLKFIGSAGKVAVAVEYFELWCSLEDPFEGLVPVGPKAPVELEVGVEFANEIDEDADDDALDVPTGPVGAVGSVDDVASNLLSDELSVLDPVLSVEEAPVPEGAAVELEVEVEFANEFDDTDDDALDVPTGPAGAVGSTDNVALDSLSDELPVSDPGLSVEEAPVPEGAAVGNAEPPVLRPIGLPATPVPLGVLDGSYG